MNNVFTTNRVTHILPTCTYYNPPSRHPNVPLLRLNVTLSLGFTHSLTHSLTRSPILLSRARGSVCVLWTPGTPMAVAIRTNTDTAGSSLLGLVLAFTLDCIRRFRAVRHLLLSVIHLESVHNTTHILDIIIDPHRWVHTHEFPALSYTAQASC